LKQYWENAVDVPGVTDEINSLNSGSECDGQSDSKSSSPSNQEPDGVKKNKVEYMFLLMALHLAPTKNSLKSLHHLFCYKSNYSHMLVVSFNSI